MTKLPEAIVKLRARFEPEIARYQEKWRELKPRDRAILAALSLALPALLYYFYVLTPKLEGIGQLESRGRDLQAQIQVLKVKEAEYRRLLREEEEVKTVLRELDRVLPEEMEISSFVARLNRDSQKFHLKVLSFSAGEEGIEGDLARTPMNMKLRGKFDSLFLFLDEMRFKRNVAVPGEIALQRAEGGEIEAEVKLAVYRALSEEEKRELARKKGRKKGRKGRKR